MNTNQRLINLAQDGIEANHKVMSEIDDTLTLETSVKTHIILHTILHSLHTMEEVRLKEEQPINESRIQEP